MNMFSFIAGIICCFCGCLVYYFSKIAPDARKQLDLFLDDQKRALLHDARVNAGLTETERCIILQMRLKKAGNVFCEKCGRVSGLAYPYADGTKKAIQLVKLNDGKYQCHDCIMRQT